MGLGRLGREGDQAVALFLPGEIFPSDVSWKSDARDRISTYIMYSFYVLIFRMFTIPPHNIRLTLLHHLVSLGKRLVIFLDTFRFF